MRTSIRFALRTLVGPWLIVPGIGLEVANFFQRGTPWLGEGMWTVEWFGIVMFVLGPLCGGAAAVDAARLSRLGNIHLVVSVPGVSRPYLRAAFWTAGPLIVLHLFAISAGLLMGQVRQPSIGWPAIIVAVLIHCAVIVWFAAVGSAIGRFATPLLAGLLGAAGGFILTYVIGDAGSGTSFQLLALGSSTITQIGRTYNPAYLAGQAGVLTVTAAMLLLLPIRARSGYRVPTAIGAVVGLLSIGTIAIASEVLPVNRNINDPRPPTFCLGSGPQICLYDEHRRYASLVVPPVDALMTAAREHGYDSLVTDRIIERSRSYLPHGPGVKPLWLPAEPYEEGRLPLEAVAHSLLTPVHCGWLSGDNPRIPDGYDVAYFSLLATWLHLVGRELEHAPVEYRILTPADVKRYIDAFDRCDAGGLH